MAPEEVQRLGREELDEVLARAKTESWTELALVVGQGPEYIAEFLSKSGWPAAHVFILNERLTHVPETFLELESLKALNLSGNRVGCVGAQAIANITTLEFLDLSHCEVGNTGGAALSRLPGLLHLILANNLIDDIGVESLENLIELKTLNLNSNSDLSPRSTRSLSKLKKLQYLDLGWNSTYDEGTNWINQLKSLVYLNLHSNAITDDGIEILSSLPQLKALHLRDNLVGDRGAAVLAKWSTLTRLDISESSYSADVFRKILDGWGFSQNWMDREYLRLTDWARDGEPIEDFPTELLRQTDAQALLAAWRRFRESKEAGESKPLNEVKVLVVGNEAVGKTSLVRYLADGLPVNENEKKTGGIAIRRDVPIENWSAEQSAVRLNIWDFGGQEIMHQTHRYFLTRRSIYLVVLDNRREDDDSVFKWLKIIKSRGGDAPALVVINKCDNDTQNLRLDEEGIASTYTNVVGFVAISCKSGSEGPLFDLRRRIKNLVMYDARLKHVRDSFPPEYLRVKNAVAAMAMPALSRADFITLCEAADQPGLRITDPKQQRSLLELLHDLGTVVAHGLEKQHGDGAREVTLLDPNWLTEAIYSLLNSRRILDNGGEFDREVMAGELDPDRYPPDRYGYIVDMMQQPEIGLCYRLPFQGEPRWLIPECLIPSAPRLGRFFADPLRFRFTYIFLPKGLFPRFIVEAFNKFDDPRLRWRTAAVLSAEGCEILVRADHDKRRIDLAVIGPEPQRRAALAVARHDLGVVHKLNPEIGKEARVPLPDDPEVDVSYEHLLQLEAEEDAAYSYRPEKAKRKYTVSELLAGVRVEGHRRVMAEPAVATTQPVRGWIDRLASWQGNAIVGGIIGGVAVFLLLPPALDLAPRVGGLLLAAYLFFFALRRLDPDLGLMRLILPLGLAGIPLLLGFGTSLELVVSAEGNPSWLNWRMAPSVLSLIVWGAVMIALISGWVIDRRRNC